MVIDDFTPINDEIVNSIVARKPLVGFSWIEVYMFLMHTPPTKRSYRYTQTLMQMVMVNVLNILVLRESSVDLKGNLANSYISVYRKRIRSALLRD